jgi:hypothetical protein
MIIPSSSLFDQPTLAALLEHDPPTRCATRTPQRLKEAHFSTLPNYVLAS